LKFEETSAYRAHAARCTNQAALTQDVLIKQYWSRLADDWIALDNTSIPSKSFAQ
jgi:hypothetical protein